MHNLFTHCISTCYTSITCPRIIHDDATLSPPHIHRLISQHPFNHHKSITYPPSPHPPTTYLSSIATLTIHPPPLPHIHHLSTLYPCNCHTSIAYPATTLPPTTHPSPIYPLPIHSPHIYHQSTHYQTAHHTSITYPVSTHYPSTHQTSATHS